MAQVKGKGSVDLMLTSGTTLTLNDVLYVPYIHRNLLFVTFLNKFGFKLVFVGDKVILTKGNVFVGKCYVCNGIQNLINNITIKITTLII